MSGNGWFLPPRRAMSQGMSDADSPYYRAYAARDARFDGVFFAGITSTGIYCRPVCPARTARPANCRFFETAAAAEQAGFRPCLRCRPELAPGAAPVDDPGRIAHLIVARLEDDLSASIDDIADQFDISARQLRRIVQAELGVSPMALVLSRRLLLAKQLLTDTRLSVTDIAYASGFSSLRRFNDAFVRHYQMPPSRLRRQTGAAQEAAGTASLTLAYRPPYDWDGILAFLAGRALTGAEVVADGAYARTVAIDGQQGWVRVSHEAAYNRLRVDCAPGLLRVLPQLLSRLRGLFDLSARPDLIAARLSQDPRLRASLRDNPGLRVPGAFDGFELGLRAILGQQVTVKAATTLGGRFVTAFGAPLQTPVTGLDRLTPAAADVAALQVDDIARLGIVGARARSIIALAGACAGGELVLAPGARPEHVMQKLQAIPGIGAWTAHYIAMRALRWPDAFPKEDIALRKALGGLTPAAAEAASQAWRPWRSYAVLHLWNTLK